MTIGGFSKSIEYNIIGRIVCRADFLHNNLLFALQLVLVELGSCQYVSQNIDGEWNIAAQNPGITGCGLNAVGGIDLAAYIFDIRCNLPCSAIICSFERHMFKQMSYS